MPARCPMLAGSLVAIAVIGASHFSAAPICGQDIIVPSAAESAASPRAAGQNFSPTRREFLELTDLLRAQQRQIDLQAAHLNQFQRELNENGTPAIPASAATETFSAARACEGCGVCEQCVPDSREYSCDSCGAAGCSNCDPGGPSVDLGGQYRLMFNASNFDFHPATLTDDQDSQTFFNQRFRTWLEMHTNRDVGVYLQVEMGHVLWGAAPEFPKTYPGPFSPPGDRVGIELRRGYLTYGNEDDGVFRAGIQDWHDAFGESYTLGTYGAVDDYDSFSAVLANSVWDFNVGGLSYAGPSGLLAETNLNAGAFVLWEGDVHSADDAFLLALDLDRPVSDQSSIGFSVYYLSDQGTYSYPITLPGGAPFAYDSSWDLWIGLRANTVLWAIPARGFVIFNTGQREELGGLPRFEHDDAALKLELGPVPFGPGKVTFQTLYSTGDGNPDETRRDGFRTIAQSARDNFGSQGYWGYLVLSSPHGPSDVNDLGVSLQNRGLGLLTIQTQYDYPIWGRLSGTIAVGWIRSDAPNPVSGSNEMGTELANMFVFDFGGGLTADFGAAVLFTGDFYRTSPAAPPPDDLYEVFTRLQLEF